VVHYIGADACVQALYLVGLGGVLLLDFDAQIALGNILRHRILNDARRREVGC